MLEYRNAKLAVVEAKPWDAELTEGVAQAKNYAGKLEIRYTYSTNGRGIYGIDMQTAREGEEPRYPTPDELWELTFAEADEWRDRFAAVPFEDRGGSHPSRYYQDIAVERTMKAIAKNEKRILLTLATGTGKTFIAFQIAWKLFYSRWNLSGQPSRRPASSSSPTVISSRTKRTTPSPPFPKMPWCGSSRGTFARRAACRRTGACSSPSSRRL